MSFSGVFADPGRGLCAASGSLSAERIDAACRLAAEGKLAARRIAAWLGGSPVNEPEFRLLWLLARRGIESGSLLDQADLAERLIVSPAQVSGAVERLRSLGLLERITSERDRRRQLWQVTHAGADFLRGIVNHVADAAARREDAA